MNQCSMANRTIVAGELPPVVPPMAPVVSAVSKPKNDSGVEPGGSHVPELRVLCFSMLNQHDCSMDFYVLYIYIVLFSVLSCFSCGLWPKWPASHRFHDFLSMLKYRRGCEVTNMAAN